MFTDYDGADVFDAAGNKIGTVERTFIDDRGATQFVEVKLGSLFAKHRLVPVDEAEAGNGGIQVPFSKDEIEHSPDTKGLGETLEGDVLDEVRAYYTPDSTGSEHGSDATEDGVASRPSDEPAQGTNDGSTGLAGTFDRARNRLSGRDEGTDTVPTSGTEAGFDDAGDATAIRDRGDYIEIPIVEEELVKRPVVKEILRVRKSSLTEATAVGADVRSEDVEVSPTGRVEQIENEE
jgi:hypothetical protein